MLGNNSGDIVTDYKEAMNGKREIPISSCPPCVEDALYGGGSDPEKGSDDGFYKPMTERLDERAAKYEKPKKARSAKPKEPVSLRISRAVGENDYTVTYCRVDTENVFEYGGILYRIENNIPQYKPKLTAVGMLYDMDKIMVIKTADGSLWFFDMDAKL